MIKEKAFVVIILVSILFGVALSFGMWKLDISQFKGACKKFGASSGREVKFVQYSFNSYDCLVKVSPDRWIPKENLGQVTFR
jgi:hypothetical protein